MKTVNHLHRIKPLLAGLLLFTCNIFLIANGESGANPLAINIAPVLDNMESDNLIYTAGAGKVNITNTLSVSDMDSRNIRSATVRITRGFIANEDILSFKNQNRISGYWNPFTGVLTLYGSSSVANYRSALRSIQYENTNTQNPSAQTRTVSFTVNDGLTNSNTVTRDIEIFLQGRAPTLSNIETAPVIYCLHAGTASITSSLEIIDPDNITLTSAKVQIFAGYTQNEDFLRFANQNGITGSWDPISGTLNLAGDALIANYRDALRSIQYENTNALNPVAGNRNISILVHDGTSPSNTVTRSIYVNGRVSGVLTGSVNICTDEIPNTPLSINFTGTPPWNFILLRNGGNEAEYKNITQDPYTFNVRQEGTYRINSISDANCTGDTTGSGYARIRFNTAPVAVISGVDTICPGQKAELQVVLTGTVPWRFTYLLNGSNPTEVNNIQTTNYTLQVSAIGTYSLSEVEDASCKGKVSGNAIVRQYVLPTATISGNEVVCEHNTADLNVVLTGTAPWKFSYRLDAGTPVDVQHVMQSPSVLTVNYAGTYTLAEVYDRNCRGTVSGTAVVTHTPAPEVTISGLAPVYDKEDDQLVPLSGMPAGGTFSGPGLFFSDPSWYFLPRYAPVGILEIIYAYQESPASCAGYDTAVVRVLEANAIIEFPNNRTKYCQNEVPFTITGINLANSTGSFTISGGAGLTDHHDNSATIDPALLTAKEYTITYTYLDGTTLMVNRKFEVGNPPVADFQWETECYIPGQSIRFNNLSTTTFGVITGSSWKIYTATGYDTATTKDIVYTFPQAGNHVIELQVQTSNGCTGNTTRTFGLRSPILLAEHNYSEDFETIPLSWQSGTSHSVPVNSWMLGDPSKGFSGASSGDYCWYTYIPGTSAPREQSWVTSPCFDFTGTKKPMIKLDIWRLFNSNRDGANLQFTADSGKNWTNLGDIGDGVNWFNQYNILGNPGNSNIGWSSTNLGVGNDAGWVEARHSLDILKDKTTVQFRIAYGSDGTAQNNNGIAFDNFWIGERTRTVLLEHFTNSSDSLSKNANLALNNLVNSDSLNIIDLQYHTSFPGTDPFNEQEPNIPGARLLYYGLSVVPYSVLNGGCKPAHWFDYNFRPLDPNTAYVESLLDSKFQIHINSYLNGNTLNIITEISPQEDMPASELTVHVAVIEKKINGVAGNNGETSFESVVKALLPDAAGTTLYKAWTVGQQSTIEDTWTMQNVYLPGEIRVVAFIQDESTKEVYQVAINTIDTISGTNDNPGSGPEDKFIVFPNPASERVFVRFEKPVSGEVRIELYNNLGSMVYTGRISRGEGETEIPTGNCPDGLYVIRAITRNQVMGIKKLTLSR